jgi:putative endonuclease
VRATLLTACGYAHTGPWGERVAARYIRQVGGRIIAYNFTFGRLEADLVAIERNTLLVIEVKTRHESLVHTFPGRSAVTRDKTDHLESLAHAFMRRHGPLCRRLGVRGYRLDTVEVYYRRGPLKRHRRVCLSWHKGYVYAAR